MKAIYTCFQTLACLLFLSSTLVNSYIGKQLDNLREILFVSFKVIYCTMMQIAYFILNYVHSLRDFITCVVL